MDMKQIRELIDELTSVMDAKRLDELQIEADGVKVVLRRSARAGDPPAAVVVPGSAGAAAAAPAHVQVPAAVDQDTECTQVIRSPMVGTFYRAPSPDAEPFVEVGDEVTPDSVLCIIEAMKVMNELKAEVEGTIQAIRAENGEAVEYGQPLFVVSLKKA